MSRIPSMICKQHRLPACQWCEKVKPVDSEVLEALRSAQELCAYLWNNTDASDPGSGNVELVAHSEKHAEQLAALLNDARTRVDAALHGIELQRADVGTTADYPRGFFARWKWLP